MYTQLHYRAAPRSSRRQTGTIRHLLLVGIVLAGCALGILRVTARHVAADSSTIKAGLSGYCLDDYHGKLVADNRVDAWRCNDSAAQSWAISDLTIRHDNSFCLSIANDETTTGTPVLLDPCHAAAGQIWLRDQSGFFNPNSGLCLTEPKAGQQLTINPCASTPTQIWSPTGQGNARDTACTGSLQDKIACAAAADWATWQAGTISHEDLLNTYTDGAPYEEWCADFVSYVYKQAGAPFTAAYDGWDENNANDIQADTGYVVHMANSSYIPRTGDIAYFDYNGGHVEIVASGGKIPTFIYGDSATIDPTTGNGQMKANTIVSDGAEGRVVYYLSPS